MKLMLFALTFEGILIALAHDAFQKFRREGAAATMDFSDRHGPMVLQATTVFWGASIFAAAFPVVAWIVGRALK